MQIVVDDLERFERLDRFDHVIAIVARAAVALANDLELPVVREPPGVLRVATVDGVAKRIEIGLNRSPQ